LKNSFDMKKYSLLLLLITLVTASGCKKYLDVNEDPRTPQLTTGETLLPHIQSYMGFAIGLDGRYTGKYVQFWVNNAANDAVEAHGSPFPNGAEFWTMHYTKMGLALDQMLFDAQTNEKWYYAGISKALRAWSWQTCTDHFGEMILKQAWQPDRYIFDYDLQPDIYAEVVKNCNEALEYFGRESPKTIQASSDYMFKGDKNRWVKFVYGILAINEHRQSNKSTYNPQKVIDFVDKSLADNADNARIQYNGTVTGSATTSDAFVLGPKRGNITSLAYVQSSTIVTLMAGFPRDSGTIDPRRANMLQPSPDGNYYGAIATFGDPNATPTTNPKRIPAVIGGFAAPWPGKYLFRDTIMFPIMTYSQMQFIKAEAALKANKPADAFTAYRNGVDKSIDMVSSYGTAITAAQKSTFMASNVLAKTATDLTLSDIMLQKYVALWGWGFEETWADMRRHKYDTTIYKGYAIPDPSRLSINNGGKLAYRFRPQNTEYLYNIDALNKLGATQADYHTKEMWFSQQ
jgi:hypothetical protein